MAFAWNAVPVFARTCVGVIVHYTALWIPKLTDFLQGFGRIMAINFDYHEYVGSNKGLEGNLKENKVVNLLVYSLIWQQKLLHFGFVPAKDFAGLAFRE